jgi:hypothetical protein
VPNAEAAPALKTGRLNDGAVANATALLHYLNCEYPITIRPSCVDKSIPLQLN